MILETTKKSQINAEQKKKRVKKRLPPAPFCVNEFINFILNKRIRLVPKFPEAAKSGQLSVGEFTMLLDDISFVMSKPADKNKMIEFFISKEDEKQKVVDFKLILSYIR